MFENFFPFEQGILYQLTDIWIMFSQFISTVYNILSTPLNTLLNLGIPVVDDILQFVINVLGIGDWSLISIMFGAGLSLFVVVVVVKFMIDIAGGD